MAPDSNFLAEIDRSVSAGIEWNDALARVLTEFAADSGTIHLLGDDGVLHLRAASAGIPQIVLETIKDVPVGKGMAGLAVERRQPVNACNIQTDASGDVRPGARATGLQGSIVVPMLRGDDAIGALGVANRGERTFTDAETERLLDVGRVLARATSAT
jgi:signal transduction protein with GAF and PtsI domain